MKEVERMLKSVEALEFALGFIVLMAVISSVAFLSGCTTGPDGIYIDETIWVYATNRIDKAVEKHGGSSSATTDTGRAGDDRAKEERDGSMVTPSDGTSKPVVADSLVLDFRYGGFKGGSAKDDSRCRISNFKMGKSGCSLKWETSIPGDWARGKDGLIVAAIFYKDGGGKWVGGKFDWIDRSRSTRDFKNIDGGYGGWNASAFRSAKKHGFCVVSADGKHRSNFIED